MILVRWRIRWTITVNRQDGFAVSVALSTIANADQLRETVFMRPAMLPVSHLGEKQQLHDLACDRQTDG
jgi:hypothetical protein